MPIASYLVHPGEGQLDRVSQQLRALPGCEVHPATNRGVLVLITDTPDLAADKALTRQLAELEGIACLSLVYGHLDEDGAPGLPAHSGGLS